MSAGWKGLPIYVGCSGNFTVERILAERGLGPLHGNDVSIYSCAIGNYLSGLPIGITVQHADWKWLDEYLDGELGTIATLLLCTEMFKYDRDEVFHRRMLAAYRKRFQDLHLQTLEKIKKALDGVQLESFFPGDVMALVESVPKDAVFVTFPPTYKSGYERLYKKLVEVFAWQAPEYGVFDDEAFERLTEAMQAKSHWCTLRDHPVEALSPYLKAMVQTGLRTKPVYVYGNDGTARVVQPNQKTEPVLFPRLSDELPGPLSLHWLTQGQFNTLRSEYLNPKIAPSSATVRLAILSGTELIGALAFVKPQSYGQGWCDAYMMTGFGVRPTIYKRISKLVVMTAMSKEVRAILEMKLSLQVRIIGTTAFTENAASMKYRGSLEVYNRKEGAVNYAGQSGRWSLKEALELWMKRDGTALVKA